MNDLYIWSAIAVIAAVTALLRFCPFAVFKGSRTPKVIEKLGRVLPCAIMGMLVVYCLKEVELTGPDKWLPQLLSCLVVGVLYLWKRNTLISIVCGTVCHMVLLQVIF